MLHLLLPFLLGIMSGFVNGFSSGGGLLSIPGLIFLGLSPAGAIATTRLSALTGGISSVIRYKKAGLISLRTIAPLIPLAIIAAIAGSAILLQINQHTLSKLVGILLLTLTPFLLTKKDFGTITKHRSRRFRIIGYIVIFLVLVYSAFFGGGGGIFTIYALLYFFGMSVMQANANSSLLNSFVAATAIIAYASSGTIRFDYGIPLMIGAAIGGYLGASSAVKKGDKVVKIAFVIIILISSVKLIFFS